MSENYKGGFEDLDVWKESRNLRKSISLLIRKFPVSEKYNLCDQLLRSSRSICANIAEGYGRFHYQENIQFCRHSRGSLLETLDHLICAKDENYISQEEFDSIKNDLKACLHKLNS